MPTASLSAERPPATSVPLKGFTEPRIFTPPLRELTPETTLGYDVIEFAHDIGVRLHPYQEWLYIHALELLPNGEFRFDTIVILIARQNGKTMWWKILILYVMYVLGMKLVLSTAQDLDTAEETWQAVVDFATELDDDDHPVRPDLADAVLKVVQKNGQKSLNLKTGERYKAKAASRRAGRGLSGDLIGLDELREQQTWDSWSAITHTTMARARSLIVGLSNAGDATSVVLRFLRKIAHAALGDPDGVNAAEDPSSMLTAADEVEDLDEDSSIGLFEWSAKPGAAIRDREAWAQANPSMNHPNGVGERKILAATKEPEWIFRTEVLCQWTDGTIEGPFPSGTWEAGRWQPSYEGETPPPIVGQVKACVDVSADHTRAHIAFAGHTAAGQARAVIVASRGGTDWVLPWLSERLDIVSEVAAQGRGAPVSNLLDEWEAEGLPIVRWQGSDLTDGTAQFYNLVRANGIEHLPQPVLDVAAATATTRPAGDGVWLWDRKKSPTDISPLVAATGATWLLMRTEVKPAVSVYETRGVMSI